MFNWSCFKKTKRTRAVAIKSSLGDARDCHSLYQVLCALSLRNFCLPFQLLSAFNFCGIHQTFILFLLRAELKNERELIKTFQRNYIYSFESVWGRNPSEICIADQRIRHSFIRTHCVCSSPSESATVLRLPQRTGFVYPPIASLPN